MIIAGLGKRVSIHHIADINRTLGLNKIKEIW